MHMAECSLVPKYHLFQVGSGNKTRQKGHVRYGVTYVIIISTGALLMHAQKWNSEHNGNVNKAGQCTTVLYNSCMNYYLINYEYSYTF